MQCVNPESALLCDFEVMDFVRHLRTDVNTIGLRRPSQATKLLQTQVDEYFTEINTFSLNWRPACVSTFLRRMRKHPLTKMEKLQILNGCPRNMVNLLTLVEDRFEESELHNMISIVNQTLPV